MRENRIQYFDGIKGLAIILVVLGHVLQRSFGQNSNIFETIIYSFHMALFMFVSGYFAYSTKERKLKDIVKFVIKKTRQLMVPFFLIGGLYSYIFSNMHSFIFSSFKMGYWFLYVLFVISIFHFIISLIKPGILQFIGYLIFLLLLLWSRKYLNDNLYSIKFISGNYPFFLLGFFIHKYSKHEKYFVNDNVISITALLFVIIMTISLNYDFYNNYIRFLLRVFAIFFFYGFFKRMNSCMLLSKLACIGEKSIYIYVFHYFFIEGLTIISIEGYTLQLIYATIVTFAITLISIYTGTLCDKCQLISTCIFGKSKNTNLIRYKMR